MWSNEADGVASGTGESPLDDAIGMVLGAQGDCRARVRTKCWTKCTEEVGIFHQWIARGKGYPQSYQRDLGCEQDSFAEFRNDASASAWNLSVPINWQGVPQHSAGKGRTKQWDTVEMKKSNRRTALRLTTSESRLFT